MIRKTYPTAKAWDKDGNEVPVDERLNAHWNRLLEAAMKEKDVTEELFSLGVTGGDCWVFLDTGSPEARAQFVEGRTAVAQGRVHVAGHNITWDSPERMLCDLERVCRALRKQYSITGASL